MIIECSDCWKNLAEITVASQSERTTKVRVLCCYCGDSSFVKTIDGEIRISGFGINDPEMQDGGKFFTKPISFDVQDDGVLNIGVVKVG